MYHAKYCHGTCHSFNLTMHGIRVFEHFSDFHFFHVKLWTWSWHLSFYNSDVKGGLVFRITKFNIKNSVPLKTVYSNITIDGLHSFKLYVVVKIKMK